MDGTEGARGGALRRVRMTVAYDGAPFHGFARQRDVVSVAGTLSAALARILRCPVELTGAGRTDAGVHARGQVVSFDAPAATLDTLGTARVERSVNRLCAPAIAVRDTAVVDDDFDARHSACWRRYRYRLLVSAVPDPLLAPTTWHVGPGLSLDLMRLACDPLIGEHDFAAFCRRGPEGTTTRRRVLATRWVAETPEVLAFEIVATAFCHSMVRSIVGTLVEVGRGRIHAGDIAWILRSGDRGRAGPVSPPQGLCLEEVGYTPW